MYIHSKIVNAFTILYSRKSTYNIRVNVYLKYMCVVGAVYKNNSIYLHFFRGNMFL